MKLLIEMNKIKTIAHYFPQFHEIEENNKWWGKGFTDWENVKKAKKNYKEHYQPRKPLYDNYYDLSEVEALRKQVELAQKYNLYGFAFYHYWFDGKLLLEKPLENLLKNKDIEFPFCAIWANETWSKRWIGKDTEILQEQKHLSDKQIWKDHFNYLKTLFQDDRYIKINDRPVFLIYQPEIINDFNDMKRYWNELSRKNGLNEIYFVAIKSHSFKNEEKIREDFDKILKFQPRESYNSSSFRNKSFLSNSIFQKLRYIPEKYLNYLTKIRYFISSYEKISYDEIWKTIINNARLDDEKIIQGCFVDWDNTPRYGKKAKIFSTATPEKFENYLRQLLKISSQKNQEFLFINAWNEWAEGAYLEPDEKYKYGYLESLKKAQE